MNPAFKENTCAPAMFAIADYELAYDTSMFSEN
jgi:hypothetical protein